MWHSEFFQVLLQWNSQLPTFLGFSSKICIILGDRKVFNWLFAFHSSVCEYCAFHIHICFIHPVPAKSRFLIAPPSSSIMPLSSPAACIFIRIQNTIDFWRWRQYSLRSGAHLVARVVTLMARVADTKLHWRQWRGALTANGCFEAV